MKLLGHLVSASGVKKCPEYVKGVLDFPEPKNVKELRSFLGMVNFQRKFLPNCSVIAKPLTTWMGMTDKTKLVWS